MNAAGIRKRVERLTVLFDGLTQEIAAVYADRGELTPQELDRYIASLYQARDGLYAAHAVMILAAERLSGPAK